MKQSIFCFFILLLSVPARSQYPVPMGEKIGYIDSTGKLINSGMFSNGTPFSEGFAAISLSSGDEASRWFFIADNFSVTIPYGYDSTGLFHEGLCPVKKNGNWFFIGTDGLSRIRGPFEEASSFRNGFARVRDKKGVYLIDTEGRSYFQGKVDDLTGVQDSTLGVRPKGQKFWLLMNLRGDTLMNDSFYAVFPGKELICVNRLGGWRYYSKKGEMQFGRAFLEATPFGIHYACIREEGDWFLLDRQGRKKQGIRLKSPVNFNATLNPAENYNGKWGYLNQAGEWIYLQE